MWRRAGAAFVLSGQSVQPIPRATRWSSIVIGAARIVIAIVIASGAWRVRARRNAAAERDGTRDMLRIE